MTNTNAAIFRRRLHAAAFWSGIVGIAIVAVVAGLILRRYAWDQTEPIRYTIDIDNAFRQGTDALRIGYLDRYDEQETHTTPSFFMDLDYGPGRLGIAMLWTKWVRETVDGPITDVKTLKPWPQGFYSRARRLGPQKQGRQYELCRPLLMLNVTGELISAVAMFLLVQRYTSGKPPRRRPARAAILGLIAALFFWFDPALISNAHCWPQWDSWVLPFFLWAILLASWNFWFCSGVIIAAGAMFKGQILFGAPMLILWPLFQGRLPAVARWIAGLLSGTAVITAVWLVRIPGTNPTGRQFIPGYVDGHAVEWVVYLFAIFAAIAALFWKRETRRVHLAWGLVIPLIVQGLIAASVTARAAHILWIVLAISLIVATWYYGRWTWHARLPIIALGVAILLIYPVYQLTPSLLPKVIVAIFVVSLLLALTPRQSIPFTAAGWTAGALLLCIPVFGGSKGWFDLGIAYGTHHYERMASGENNNLAALLKENWAWDDLMAPAITLPSGKTADRIADFLTYIDPGVHFRPGREISLPLKYFLLCLWVIAMVISAIGAAKNDRTRNARFLAVIAAPWIAFFAVMSQMHQRYLLWGASLSSATAALSPGYALLHLFLSFVSWTQELTGMADDRYISNNPGQVFAKTPLMQFVKHTHPGIAYAVLLIAAIYLYTAVKWKPQE